MFGTSSVYNTICEQLQMFVSDECEEVKWSNAERIFCVKTFSKTYSIITMLREFHQQFNIKWHGDVASHPTKNCCITYKKIHQIA